MREKMRENETPITIRIETETLNKLRELAKTERRSINNLINVILANFVDAN